MAVNDPVAGKKASFCCGVDLWWGLGVKKPPQARSSCFLLNRRFGGHLGWRVYNCGAQPCSSVDYGNPCNTIRIGWRKIILMGKSPGHEIVEEASWLTELAGATS